MKPTIEKLDVVGKYKGNVGRPFKYSEKDFEAIKLIPLLNWTSLRLVGMQIGIPYTTVWRYWKRGQLKKSTVNMKPALTKEHMEERLKWCESFIKEYGTYKDMVEYIHVDEKWFYLGKVKNYFYMLPEEAEPHFTCQKKIVEDYVHCSCRPSQI